ncbi:MAG: hypothetical protein ACNS62_07265 [Candidatus Cyclobacteriaceae bacterium M3_2C_046]
MKYKPWQLYLGVVLVVLFWFLNWYLDGLRTHWGFFFLWLGYILTIDGVVYLKKKHSLITRNYKAFIGLFLISAPAWWLFELIDLRTNYWIYLGKQHFTDLEYFMFASLSFSTVLPAVFETSELTGTIKWFRWVKGPQVVRSAKTAMLFFVSGWIMLILLLIWPEYFPAFVWMSLYFIFEPINFWIRGKTLWDYTQHRNWGPVITLWLGCLICGFFWEMWNYYSYPKWIYDVPFINFWYIFEMPLLGYLGYLPFALELYALYHLVVKLLGLNDLCDYLELASS